MITEKLKAFFSNIPKNNNEMFLVVRADGIPVYASSAKETQSMSALVGGVWQAANALASFLPNPSSDEVFRLSFDTSSKGVYILPIHIEGSEFFLSVVYNEENNPGRLKNKVRGLREKLYQYLNESSELDPEKNNFLFNNISDEEIDNVFSFMGN